jgi:hypothetical protein
VLAKRPPALRNLFDRSRALWHPQAKEKGLLPMPIAQELETAIGKLPLEEREALATAIEHSIEDEYNRMAEVSVAADMQKVERILATHLFTDEQMHELQARVDAADRGEAQYLSWDQVRQEILVELRREE